MKYRRTFLIAAFISCARIALAQTEIITFDDFPSVTSPNANYPQVSAGYNGLQWSNFDVIDAVDSLPNGGQNGTVSPKNVAFNANGTSASFGVSGSFDLESAWLTAAWNDGLQIEAQGYVGGVLTYDNTYIVNTTAPTLVNFNYLGVNEVNFIPSGGTHHTGYNGFGTVFVMDNLSVTLVPEPSRFVLIGLGVVLLNFCRRETRPVVAGASKSTPG